MDKIKVAMPLIVYITFTVVLIFIGAKMADNVHTAKQTPFRTGTGSINGKFEKSLDSITTFTISSDMYGLTVDVIITDNVYEARYYVSTNLDIPLDDDEFTGYAGKTFSVEGLRPIVWIRKVDDTPESKSTVTHELMHLTQYTLTRSAIILNESTSEVFAYQIGYYEQQFYNELNKHSK